MASLSPNIPSGEVLARKLGYRSRARMVGWLGRHGLPSFEVLRDSSGMFSACRSLALSAVAVGLVACSAGPSRGHLLENPGDSGVVVRLQESPRLCSECISFQEIAVLGDTGAGFVEPTSRAVRDNLGRFWVNQRDHLKVYEADGKYVGEVGRPGQGPMEFSVPYPVHAEADGRVFVLDPGNQRVSVVGPQFELLSEAGLPGPNVHDFLRLPGKDIYVLNMWLATAEGIGHPLHVAKGREVLRSFGADSVGTHDPLKLMRILATDPSGRIYSAKRFTYEIEVWTELGRRVIGFSGPTLNQREPDPGRPYGLDENPVPHTLVDMQSDGQHLWVQFLRVKENWREHLERHTDPRGIVGLRLRPGTPMDSILKTRVEVVSLSTGVIVARQEVPGVFNGFLGPNLLLENRSGADDVPHVVIWRASLNLH